MTTLASNIKCTNTHRKNLGCPATVLVELLLQCSPAKYHAAFRHCHKIVCLKVHIYVYMYTHVSNPQYANTHAYVQSCTFTLYITRKFLKTNVASDFQTNGNQRLRLNVCESVKQGRGGWNLKMKSRLRRKVCEARQKGGGIQR